MARARAIASVIGALLAARVACAAAQQPLPNHPGDTTAVDTTRKRGPDTLSTTDQLLKAEKDDLVHRATMPQAGVTPLFPAGGRIVFTRDSIDWAPAEDLGELLSRVTGVFLERSDWIGSPVLPNYFGLGAGSVEYLLDGVPWLPIGADSMAADPSTLSLEFFDRVEVERAPNMLRVFLFTRQHDRASPRTKIGVAQGDRGVARYFGDFERRYKSGIGIGVAADYVGVNPVSTGTLTSALPSGGGNIPSGWAQLSYVPTPHFGVQAQMMTQVVTRNQLIDETSGDTLSPQVNSTRTDAQFRMFWRRRDDELGPSVNLFAAHTSASWNADSVIADDTDDPTGNIAAMQQTRDTSVHRTEGIGEFGGVAAMREPTWSAQLSTWHYTQWTTLDSRLDLGWTPRAWATASVQLVGQRYDGDRRGQWITGRAGFQLPLGFHVGGDVSQGHRVQIPSLSSDSVARFVDAEGTFGFASKPFALDAGYMRESGWRPVNYPEFAAIDSFAALPRTDWVTAHVRYAPVRFFTLETVFQHPLHGVLPNGSPPDHAITTATLRSRFLRNFPSGIFDLKLQVVAESWGSGIGGLAANGSSIVLPGATFYRAIIQLQLGPFIAYYDRDNLQATRSGYVPGYPIQPLGATFGIRWEFSN